MWKPVDYQCTHCEAIHEETVWVTFGDSWPRVLECLCSSCDETRMHHSVMGLPAPYMGERVLNPEMYGGAFDTMGAVEHKPLPDLPGEAEHSAKLRSAMSKLPDNATSKERKLAFSEACKGGPSSADYAMHFAKPEYKEVEAQNKRITEQNAAKRKRAKAMRRGENVNMRRDKCPGDPKVSA